MYLCQFKKKKRVAIDISFYSVKLALILLTALNKVALDIMHCHFEINT